MKLCTNKNCSQVNPQPRENFSPRNDKKDGLASRCKRCVNYYSTERRKDPEVRESKRIQGLKRYHELAKDPEYRKANALKQINNSYRKYKTDRCASCKFIALDRCQLDVDHIDGDHFNNDPSNLQTLCANCHRLKTKLNKDGVYNQYELKLVENK